MRLHYTIGPSDEIRLDYRTLRKKKLYIFRL